MHRLIKPIFWSFLFLIMILVIDQFLIQVPPVHPAHAAVSHFYQDFRGRLSDLTFGEKAAQPNTIEAVIEKQKSQKASSQKTKKTGQKDEVGQKQSLPNSKSLAKKSPRYLYSDGKGELYFVDSLEEVPDEYRGQAQPMGE